MASVTFKRTNNIDSVPIVDGQLVFDTSDQKIYLDNGNTREVYGGGSGTDLISNVSDATDNNAFNANATVNLFTRKSSIVDTKAEIQSVTQAGVPLGCKGFNEVIGTGDISALGDGSVTGAILANKSAIDTVNQNLTTRYYNGKIQYYENGQWNDWVSPKPSEYVSVLTQPVTNNVTPEGTISSEVLNPYTAFTTSGLQLTDKSVVFTFNTPTYVDAIRYNAGSNGTNFYQRSVLYVSYDGNTFEQVGQAHVPSPSGGPVGIDYTEEIHNTIKAFKVTAGASNSQTTIKNLDALIYS